MLVLNKKAKGLKFFRAGLLNVKLIFFFSWDFLRRRKATFLKAAGINCYNYLHASLPVCDCGSLFALLETAIEPKSTEVPHNV